MLAKRAVSRLPFVVAIAAVLLVATHAAAKDSDVVAAITKLENDAVKAELANDKGFFEKNLTPDFVGSSSFGERETRESMLKDMSDPQNNKVNKREISDLKVRVYGNAAIATYNSTYDMVYRGEPRSRTIIVTDVFVKEKGGWKLAGAHASEAKK